MTGKPDTAEYAEQMQRFVETWLGNSITRPLLKFATGHCKKCGGKVDLAAKDFVGLKPKMCLACKIQVLAIKQALNFLIKKMRIDEKDVVGAFKDPLWRKGLESTLEGIAEFGPKKPFTSFSPFLVVWNITRTCNLKCKHCYESAANSTADELNTVEALKAVDDLSEGGVAYVAISGGEPLARKDFFDIAKRLGEKEVAFSVATNGTLITKENAQRLRDLNCLYVQISLDGAKARTHNSFRGTNSFERTIRGIKNAVSSDLVVGIAMTATKHNLKEVQKAVELAEQLGVQIFICYNFIPTGRGKQIASMDLSPEQRETLLQWLSQQIGKRKINVLSTAPQYSRICLMQGKACSLTHFDVISQDQTFAESLKFLAEFVGGCGAGRLYMALEPNGDLEPCVFMPLIIGNIKKDSLQKVWHNNGILQKLRKREEFSGNCGACENRNICGGCRARALAYFNDVQAPDPGCIKNIEYWNQLKQPITAIARQRTN